MTFDGVMLSAGVSSSDSPSSGLTPSVIVPRVNAPDAISVSTPRPIRIGASTLNSTPVIRTSA